jgi:hypothetical protein
LSLNGIENEAVVLHLRIVTETNPEPLDTAHAFSNTQSAKLNTLHSRNWKLAYERNFTDKNRMVLFIITSRKSTSLLKFTSLKSALPLKVAPQKVALPLKVASLKLVLPLKATP